MEVSSVNQNDSTLQQLQKKETEEFTTKKVDSQNKQAEQEVQKVNEESQQVAAQKTGVGNNINLNG